MPDGEAAVLAFGRAAAEVVALGHGEDHVGVGVMQRLGVQLGEGLVGRPAVNGIEVEAAQGLLGTQ